ncbi:MAG TPA: hypothetical protein VHF45_04110 [Thermoleophilaceae bacterium]|jgi:membrane protein|nr:hypothetical protein [Thermoleophilaceae bacterium]
MVLGAELNAGLERGRQIEAGNPPDKEPFLSPREPGMTRSHAGSPRSG